MKNTNFKMLIVTFLFVSFQSYGTTTDIPFFEQANSFFAKYVKDGKVNYKAVKGSKADLTTLTDYISSAPVSSFSADEKKAFYINSYNLLVIKGIVDAYPVKSPMDINGFFDQKKHSIGGEKLTLNDIENKKVRAVYKDSRIHFVLVCAALGCPKITNFAYMPTKLDTQLETQTKQAINDPNFIRVKGKKVFVSEIFKWYKDDFTNEKDNILNYVNAFHEQDLSGKIDYYTYDWTLNETK